MQRTQNGRPIGLTDFCDVVWSVWTSNNLECGLLRTSEYGESHVSIPHPVCPSVCTIINCRQNSTCFTYFPQVRWRQSPPSTVVKTFAACYPASVTFASNIRRSSGLHGDCRRLRATFDVRWRTFDVRPSTPVRSSKNSSRSRVIPIDSEARISPG